MPCGYAQGTRREESFADALHDPSLALGVT